MIWTLLIELLALPFVWLRRRAILSLLRPIPSLPLTEKLDREALVSVIVPARNEQRNIENCVRRLGAQRYPRFEIIVVDDCSSDQTGEIAEGLGAGNKELHVVREEPPPPGWVGKCWAAYQGVSQAVGEWLVFIDADTSPEPNDAGLTRGPREPIRD